LTVGDSGVERVNGFDDYLERGALFTQRLGALGLAPNVRLTQLELDLG
jgi:hypothetical protein